MTDSSDSNSYKIDRRHLLVLISNSIVYDDLFNSPKLVRCPRSSHSLDFRVNCDISLPLFPQSIDLFVIYLFACVESLCSCTRGCVLELV